MTLDSTKLPEHRLTALKAIRLAYDRSGIGCSLMRLFHDYGVLPDSDALQRAEQSNGRADDLLKADELRKRCLVPSVCRPGIAACVNCEEADKLQRNKQAECRTHLTREQIQAIIGEAGPESDSFSIPLTEDAIRRARSIGIEVTE